ncbi:3-oxoacyl-ACP synthase III family protein [Polynucleobacter sp. MG-27-Goln-C1]|uniref:3-oxoacyl-ACP synthase III family protein n=1 Tax=Polynucleobacter sp. MG-27-Goln-C1 TaxID=1819726 RepID=UPI001C0DCCD3|nr:ketoacyl-ACP synthase III [Polynucleobacter sp. MG-27-Goln-C1]MBU3612868.1 ketoacyl-ACP synthase III [Polynucleobacter sp. MG-27-Goln-C1]
MLHSLDIGIEGVEFCLGQNSVSNSQLQEENPSWDMSKTLERSGVKSRPVAIPGTTALDLAYEAANKLLNQLKCPSSEIDALIFCTQTPDYVLPPNSSLLHGRLNLASNVMAFDISHACSGFIYGLGIARSLVASGTAKKVLLITADTYTRLIHPADRSIRPLFGDGAAATIVSSGNLVMKIKDMSFGTAGKKADRFIVEAGGARNEAPISEEVILDRSGRITSSRHISMDGLGLLSYFNNVIPISVLGLLEKNGKNVSDVSLFLFHQASRLALEGIMRSLKIPDNKMIIDMEETGNLVSSSIPVLLSRLLKGGAIPEGEPVILCGFGVGLSWGTALVEF